MISLARNYRVFAFLCAAFLAATPGMAQTPIVIQGFEGFEVGTTRPFVCEPGFSGSSSVNVLSDTNVCGWTCQWAQVSEEYANDVFDPCIVVPGTKSMHTHWTFTDANYGGRPWVRLTTYTFSATPNPVIDISQGVGFFVYSPANEFWLHLGIREVTTDEPIGGNGGTSGTIEYVGATNDNGVLRGTRLIEPSTKWQHVYFDLPNIPAEEIIGFTGDGVLSTANNKAVLEHLAVTAITNDANGVTFDIWWDDFYVGDPITPLAQPLEMKITDIQRLGTGNLQIDFTTLYPGRDHFVQEKTDAMATEWTDVAGATLGTPVCDVYLTAEFPDPGAPQRVYRVASVPAAPLFSDNFDGGDLGWTHGGAADTWAVGTPTAGPGAPFSAPNSWATGLSAPYPADAAMWLRSPAIDLTTAPAATLKFQEFYDVDAGFHYVTLYAKDAANPDGPALATLYSNTGTSAAWAEVNLGLVSPVLGSNIVLEFVLTSDFDVSFGGQGWFIDDVSIVPE